jgi:valyl-tRNA synthetase
VLYQFLFYAFYLQLSPKTYKYTTFHLLTPPQIQKESSVFAMDAVKKFFDVTKQGVDKKVDEVTKDTKDKVELEATNSKAKMEAEAEKGRDKIEGEVSDAREKLDEEYKNAGRYVIDEKEKLETEAKVKLDQFFGDK